MSFDFHKDKQRYFNMQYQNSREFVLPMIEKHLTIDGNTRVLEIGCAEAGVLKAFTERGCECVGIELAAHRLELAKAFMKEEVDKGLLSLLNKNIHDVDIEADVNGKFDLVILKDVIEHIHDQESFIKKLREFVKDGGFIFYGFPPWYMPFGGHQQNVKNKFLSLLPYYHLLPMPLYKAVLKGFGETQVKVDNMVEIKETGISIERFERIVKRAGFSIPAKRHFLFNPIYRYKFGVEPRGQFALISAIPFVRNFFTTAVYYLTKMEA